MCAEDLKHISNPLPVTSDQHAFKLMIDSEVEQWSSSAIVCKPQIVVIRLMIFGDNVLKTRDLLIVR